jgi:hypothetical protein
MEPSQSTENSEQISQTEQPQPLELYIVLVSEFDAPQLLTFSSAEEVANCIKEYKQSHKRFNAYVFEGKRWHTTSGHSPYLVSYDNNVRVPLFDEDPEDQINESGLID